MRFGIRSVVSRDDDREEIGKTTCAQDEIDFTPQRARSDCQAISASSLPDEIESTGNERWSRTNDVEVVIGLSCYQLFNFRTGDRLAASLRDYLLKALPIGAPEKVLIVFLI